MSKHLLIQSLAAALFLAGVPASAGMRCFEKALEADPESANAFMGAVIDALESAKAGAERLRDVSETVSLAEFMALVRTGQKDFECAQNLVAPYKDSKNVFIALNSGAVWSAIVTLHHIEERFQKLLVEVTDHPTRYGSGTTAEKFGRIKSDRSERWIDLAKSVAASTGTLYRFKDDRPDGLVITRSQKQELLAKLEESFGPKVKSKPKGGDMAYDVAAKMLYEFLTDETLKPSDER